jgi:TRAP-type mannitol/chloroaromatic compound transport system permease large subunit
MKVDTPRIPPLAVEEMDEESRVPFGDGPILNIFRTLAQHPKLMKRWLVFGTHVLGKSTLPAREREIVILRIGWLLPVVKVLGVDPIHFGIVMIVCSSMGFLTPPVGVNLFVGCSIANISIEKLSVAVMPFLLTMIVALLVLTFIPQITLWLPGL